MFGEVNFSAFRSQIRIAVAISVKIDRGRKWVTCLQESALGTTGNNKYCDHTERISEHPWCCRIEKSSKF